MNEIKMSFGEYLKRVNLHKTTHPNLRYGQALFNVLYEIYPELADDIRSTNNDPYYSDDGEIVGKFLTRVSEKFN